MIKCPENNFENSIKTFLHYFNLIIEKLPQLRFRYNNKERIVTAQNLLSAMNIINYVRVSDVVYCTAQ